MLIKSIDPLSCAKVLGIIYALLGFLFGGLFSLFALAGVGAGAMSEGDTSAGDALAPLLGFGAAAILIFPILYGIMGAISGGLGALIYNVVSHLVGGIRVDLGES